LDASGGFISFRAFRHADDRYLREADDRPEHHTVVVGTVREGFAIKIKAAARRTVRG
jgi:hypothetical protein